MFPLVSEKSAPQNFIEGLGFMFLMSEVEGKIVFRVKGCIFQ